MVNFVIEKGLGRTDYAEINNVCKRITARDLNNFSETGIFVTNNKRGWALRYLLRQ